MTMKPLPLVLLLCSCVTTQQRLLLGAPDYTDSSGPSIYWHGVKPDPQVSQILASVHAAALTVCPAHNAEIEAKWKGLLIVYHTNDFMCGTIPNCQGCQASPDAIDVISSDYIKWEFGHIVWEICFNRSGEHFVSVADPDFDAWLHPKDDGQ